MQIGAMGISEPDRVTLWVGNRSNWNNLKIEKMLFGLPRNESNIDNMNLYIKFENERGNTYSYSIPETLAEDIYYDWIKDNPMTNTNNFFGYTIEYDQSKYAIEGQTHVYNDYAGHKCAEQSFEEVPQKYGQSQYFDYKTMFWNDLYIYSKGWENFKINNPDEYTDKSNNFEEYWKLRTADEVINIYPNLLKDSTEEIIKYVEVDIDEKTGNGEIRVLFTKTGKTKYNNSDFKILVGIYRKIDNSRQYWGVYKYSHSGFITLTTKSGETKSNTFKNFEKLVSGWNYNR